MKLPISVIIYVLIQISSCTQSDVSAEELLYTNPMVSTSAYSVLDTEFGTEDVASSNLTASPVRGYDSIQGIYDTTTSSNLHSTASSKITWNAVNSVTFSTDARTKNPNYKNTFPSSSLQNYTQHSATNMFNNQTPSPIFENLDHEENELDSDTRVTGMSKVLKTTSSTDFPTLHSHKLETVHTESSTDNQHISHVNVHNLLPESENESISMNASELDLSVESNVTGIPLSPVSDNTMVEGSISTLATEVSNQELSAESIEVSTVRSRDETIISNSNLFDSSQVTSENLPRDNLAESEKMENATFVTDSIEFSQDDNLKSTTPSITDINVENKEQESSFNNSSLDLNFTYAGITKDHDLATTLSFSEKSNEGQELISQLNSEVTPASSVFDLSEKNSEPTTVIVLNTSNIDKLTSEETQGTISTTLPLNVLTSSRIPTFTTFTVSDEPLLQNSSNLNFLQENHLSTMTEVPNSDSSYTTSVKPSYQENFSPSTFTTQNKFSTIADDDITTASLETDVSSNFKLNNETLLIQTGGSEESTTLSTSFSANIEMGKTILPTAYSVEHSTSSDDEINQTVPKSFESNRLNEYDGSTILNTENETHVYVTNLVPGLKEIGPSTYSSANNFENASELLTTIDPNRMTEQNLSSTKILSTAASDDIEKSITVTYLPSDKQMDRKDLTESFTEKNTVPQTIPYNWLSSARTQSPQPVTNDVEEENVNTNSFIPSHKDINKETFTHVFTETQTSSHHPPSSTTLEQSTNAARHSLPSFFQPIHDFSTEETSTSKLESYTVIDGIATSLPDSFLSSIAEVITDTSRMPSQTYREGKHIPFSVASTVKVTDLSSEYGFLFVTTEKTSVMKAQVNDTEVHYFHIQIEDMNLVDRSNMITAVIQFPVNSDYKTDRKGTLARTHQWLDKVLTKEFRNWTGDPFEEAEEQENEIPFGNISIFYVEPTPETNASHITLTFIAYNSWRNRTLPVHFALGTLNYYSKELKELINSSSVYFYHGLSTENYDLLSAVFDKYGIMIFIICLAVVGIIVLVCVVVFYRKKTRQSIHYLADSKLQQNLQEAVGIDLTPATIILQDEKEEKGSKICDDEGWLVPIADVPIAEDNNVPNIQDTKL